MARHRAPVSTQAARPAGWMCVVPGSAGWDETCDPLTPLDAIRHVLRSFSRDAAAAVLKAVLQCVGDEALSEKRRLERIGIVAGTAYDRITAGKSLTGEWQRRLKTALLATGMHAIDLVAERRAAGQAAYSESDWADVGTQSRRK